jgi:hypothetical protein
MTSSTRIPREAFPCFLTLGQDYFPTKDPAYTNDQFQTLAAAGRRGLLLHLHEEAHMPRSKSLRYVLGKYIDLAQKRASRTEIQEILWPVQPMLILELRQGSSPQELWSY